ncbi:DUF3732 domain-containing protein [Clostridium sp. PL3]|uniref:DUF3732 domain-containing protein n=1 Tax=Clostridium thailandense TaxID=2794346 RepID=A0A949TW70_9CLOT|nr:DUF3732 domain-containing protein [Clostridium thailandense]MBV7271484.1 DUF3732 domain-containing protein [Clostridium thailandense]
MLNEENERYVDLTEGVNIITGESKTGKSALVEIIDYCLCSSSCTIPKGRITEFADIYSLIIVINSQRYIIARKAPYTYRKEMYISRISDNINYKSINMKFFEDCKFYNYKVIQKQIEKLLGLNVTNLKDDGEEKKESASLRNMTSYMFQHQNLMASKFALFYRFDDYQKKKDIIEQFPIFAGIVDQEFYSTLMLINAYKKELKKLLANQVSNEKIKEDIRNNLIDKFKEYFALLGRELNDNLTLDSLINLGNDLPNLKDEYSSSEIVTRYNKLKNEIEELRDKEDILKSKISNLESADENSSSYISSLEVLKQKSDLSSDEIKEYICPICGHECGDLNEISIDVKEATKWLSEEMKLIDLSNDNLFEEKRKLIKEKDKVIKEIKRKWAQKRSMEKEYLEKSSRYDLENKLNYKKIEIKFLIETIDKGLFNSIDEEIVELQKKIVQCNEDIKAFNLEESKENAKNSINKNMNRLKVHLDFEEEFKHYNLYFDLEEFELSLRGKNRGEKVILSEMGSGANWVSCHIALFLSLLRYFASQGEKSPMPTMMFFDQPSQVYFPQDNLEDTKKSNIETEKDKQAVTKMYKVMFDEIEDTYKDTETKPQLIVVDHVNYSTMQTKKEQDYFKKSTRRTWRGMEALI